MNDRTLFIIALLIALFLHTGIGYLMLHDEQNRIELYQQEELLAVTLIPTNEIEAPADQTSDKEIDEEINKEQITPETAEATTIEESSDEMALEEESEDTQKEDEPSEADLEENLEEDLEEEATDEPLPYQRNTSEDGEYLQDHILPPREEGDYRRIITTEENPYQKLVDDAIALLEETPFLDKNWEESEDDSDQPNYYSPQFIDLLKQYNPQNFKENDVAVDDAVNDSLDEIEDEIKDDILNEMLDEGNDEVVEIDEALEEMQKAESTPLIVHYLDSPDSEPMPIEMEKAEEGEDEKREKAEVRAYRNIYNAAESHIRRLEYNVSLKSTQCYDRYIKGQNRQYRVALIIYENPLRTGIYKSSGNDQLDRCIVEMTNQFIQIPAEMERIRKHAPRRGDAYLLNASF